MPSDRAALALVLVGLLLVPGPAYAFALDDLGGEERYRTSAGYSAAEIDASNDTVLADRYAAALTFRSSSLQYRHVREEYRAPNETREALDTAMADGDASVGSDAVAADVRRIERNYTFLTVEYDSYYAFTLADGELTTTAATDSEIAAAVRDRLIANYSELSPAERRTFRKIRNATVSEEAYDYRPWSDEPVPDAPIVERDGTYYAVEVTSHTDDIGFPDGLLIGLVAAGIGLVAVVGGAVTLLYNRWRS